MKVKAIKLGYYDNIRQREGAIFVLKDPKHFSARWMESLEKEAPREIVKEEVKEVSKAKGK